MYLPDLVIRSRRIVTRDGTRPAALHIRGGRIIGVLDFDDVPAGCPLDDAADLVVLPGLVDTHVHTNEPGDPRGQGFDYATRAAAAGGVTTVIDMPWYGQPGTTSVAALEEKRRAAAGRCVVDVGFWAGVVPGNASDLSPLAEAGVFGFACSFVMPPIDGAVAVTERDLRIAMPALARLGALLLVHAELAGPLERGVAAPHVPAAFMDRLAWWFQRRRQYTAFLNTRPKEVENEAVLLLLQLCREFRTRTHILHLSSADALTPIFHARTTRLPVTVETSPHYLFFVAEEVADGATAFKCSPPIRDRLNRELLWGAVSGGLIQVVVSGHSPPPLRFRHRRSRDFLRAWGGVAALRFSLPAMWTAASVRGHTINDVAAWMCRAPAQLAGLPRKGSIEVGYDADVVVFDPAAEFTVDGMSGHPRDSPTPYVGRKLRGVIERTYLRGTQIFCRGKDACRPGGRLLARV